MALGKFRCIATNVTDLERGGRFWSEVTGTVEDVDVAVQQALALGATLFKEKGTYPIGAPKPYLEWAVMRDPFGNSFCLIRDLVGREP